MSYTCQDCSYTSSKGFANGRCPGCGSANIRSNRNIKTQRERKPRSKLEILIMLILWSIFIYGGWKHYYSDKKVPFEEKAMTIDSLLPNAVDKRPDK